ncbi:hypothetical protein HPB49_011294 [Dermacentor silvarum]|uniref:Uncharacterized protein n=1 Tax=Dermacentor silvarum TaxID=543639 RepID=A0ACB8DCI9_DERSI|nr:hypothetical protein HPB49_011294 [Dermacentor silvarum]
MIRNLSDKTIGSLTEFFNDMVWTNDGILLKKWKEVKTILILNPHKPSDISKLGPISQTSWAGKLFEKSVQAPLRYHIELNNMFPSHMVGFRHHVWAQDVFRQLKYLVLYPIRGSEETFVLAFDIKTALDTISHHAILEGLEAVHC